MSVAKTVSNFLNIFPSGLKFFLIFSILSPVSAFALTQDQKFFKSILGQKPPALASNLPAEPSLQDIENFFLQAAGSGDVFYAIKRIYQKTGYLVTYSQSLNQDAVECLLSARDIQTIEMTFDFLPHQFHRLSSLKKILCGTLKGAGAYASPRYLPFGEKYSGVLVFIPHQTTTYIGDMLFGSNVIHEMAHHFDFSQGENGNFFSYSSGFVHISWYQTWKLTGGKVRPEQQQRFTSEYGKTNYLEDFAEALTSYVTDPERLRQSNLEKYEFLKENVFKGQEFLPDQYYNYLNQNRLATFR